MSHGQDNSLINDAVRCRPGILAVAHKTVAHCASFCQSACGLDGRQSHSAKKGSRGQLSCSWLHPSVTAIDSSPNIKACVRGSDSCALLTAAVVVIARCVSLDCRPSRLHQALLGISVGVIAVKMSHQIDELMLLISSHFGAAVKHKIDMIFNSGSGMQMVDLDNIFSSYRVIALVGVACVHAACATIPFAMLACVQKGSSCEEACCQPRDIDLACLMGQAKHRPFTVMTVTRQVLINH